MSGNFGTILPFFTGFTVQNNEQYIAEKERYIVHRWCHRFPLERHIYGYVCNLHHVIVILPYSKIQT